MQSMGRAREIEGLRAGRERQRERQKRRFKSAGQTRRILSIHGVLPNLFQLGRHHLRSENYRLMPDSSFRDWSEVTAA